MAHTFLQLIDKHFSPTNKLTNFSTDTPYQQATAAARTWNLLSQNIKKNRDDTTRIPKRQTRTIHETANADVLKDAPRKATDYKRTSFIKPV